MWNELFGVCLVTDLFKHPQSRIGSLCLGLSSEDKFIYNLVLQWFSMYCIFLYSAMDKFRHMDKRATAAGVKTDLDSTHQNTIT